MKRSPWSGAGVFGGAVLAVAAVFTVVAGDGSGSAAAAPVAAGTDGTPSRATVARGFITVQAVEEVRADEVIGMPVSGRGGAQIGEIRDMVFDRHNRLVGFVLATGGVLGIGTRDVAVTPEAIRFEGAPGQRSAHIGMSEDELAAAPEFRALESGVVMGLLGLAGTPVAASGD